MPQPNEPSCFIDVGRFEEGTLRYQAEQNKEYIAAASSQLNHGDLGYNTLLKNPLYNDPRILAAVKFHGLMMEDVYNAPEWQNFMLLSNKEEINQILFLVRDADKLANLQSIQKEQSLYRDIFISNCRVNAATRRFLSMLSSNLWRGRQFCFQPSKHLLTGF